MYDVNNNNYYNIFVRLNSTKLKKYKINFLIFKKIIFYNQYFVRLKYNNYFIRLKYNNYFVCLNFMNRMLKLYKSVIIEF